MPSDRSKARHELTAVHFVGFISAIVVAVTPERFEETLLIGALELIRFALRLLSWKKYHSRSSDRGDRKKVEHASPSCRSSFRMKIPSDADDTSVQCQEIE